MKWIKFRSLVLYAKPSKPDKYLVCRKDDKIHRETWNGSGWAYNGDSISYWAKIELPNKNNIINYDQ